MTFNLSNPIGTGTDAELLELTRAAIAQITVHGQSYQMGERQLTRADLPTLHEQVKWLEARLAAASRRPKSNIVALQRSE